MSGYYPPGLSDIGREVFDDAVAWHIEVLGGGEDPSALGVAHPAVTEQWQGPSFRARALGRFARGMLEEDHEWVEAGEDPRSADALLYEVDAQPPGDYGDVVEVPDGRPDVPEMRQLYGVPMDTPQAPDPGPDDQPVQQPAEAPRAIPWLPIGIAALVAMGLIVAGFLLTRDGQEDVALETGTEDEDAVDTDVGEDTEETAENVASVDPPPQGEEEGAADDAVDEQPVAEEPAEEEPAQDVTGEPVPVEPVIDTTPVTTGDGTELPARTICGPAAALAMIGAPGLNGSSSDLAGLQDALADEGVSSTMFDTSDTLAAQQGQPVSRDVDRGVAEYQAALQHFIELCGIDFAFAVLGGSFNGIVAAAVANVVSEFAAVVIPSPFGDIPQINQPTLVIGSQQEQALVEQTAQQLGAQQLVTGEGHATEILQDPGTFEEILPRIFELNPGGLEF